MDFLQAVKGLEEGKIFRREGWNKAFSDSFKRITKDEYGMLNVLSMTHAQKFVPTDEDVLANDWIEVEKENYQLINMEVEDGIQSFTIARNNASIQTTVRRFEFKQMFTYLDIQYEDEYKEVINGLLYPTLPDFAYNFRVCAICDHEIEYKQGNDGFCPNGCVEYDVDPQGENVGIILFDSECREEQFLVSLYEDGWHGDNRRMKVDLQKFLESVAYWRENERYKERKKK